MDNVIFPFSIVKLTAKDGNIYNGKVTHIGAYSDKGPITLLFNDDKEEKKFERDEIVDIEIIEKSDSNHYSSRGGKKSQRRKNKRNTKRKNKRNTKRRS